MQIKIEKPEDWLTISQIGGPVVDPMILRCGELFLRGPVTLNNNDPVAAWDLITRNIHALGTFFDHLILDEQIPVFNYADTFDIMQNFDQSLLSRVNIQAGQDLLVDVNVQHNLYWEVKTAALEELKKLYSGGGHGVDAQQAQNILGELADSGYAWYPDLNGLVLPNQSEERLAAFILGGLIFGGYAQLAGTDHLMQPKRSRLFLALALQQNTARTGEQDLFQKLGELAGHPSAEVPFTPTFFPMLLHSSSTPDQLLANAITLRQSGEVHDYRAWLRDALADFDTNGRIPIARAREVDKIAKAIQKKISGLPFPKIEIKMTATDVLALKPPTIGIDLTEPAKASWGWLLEQLPGRRHRKLLTRAIIADHEYVELDRRILKVWNAH